MTNKRFIQIDKRFIAVFLLMFIFTGISSYLVYKLFILEKKIEHQDAVHENCAYKEIDFTLPVQAFLKRCASSDQLSYVRRLFVNQWISSNQNDLTSLIMYAQGATNYDELKKAFMIGIEKESHATAAASFITGAIKTIDADPALIEHVTKSLKEGYGSAILALRGQMMKVDSESKEYKKLLIEYKNKLDAWINEKHGKLLDEVIAKM
jgi:hypothetical protein